MERLQRLNILIDIPLGLSSACEQLNIDPQTAFQHFLDNISIYFHLKGPADSPQAVASAIFDEYLKARGIWPKRNWHNRQLSIDNMTKIISMTKSEFGFSKVAYDKLIDKWYQLV